MVRSERTIPRLDETVIGTLREISVVEGSEEPRQRTTRKKYVEKKKETEKRKRNDVTLVIQRGESKETWKTENG